MSEMYSYYLQKHLEQMTNLESHLLVLQDKNNLLNHAKDIVLYLYPYRIIFVEQNVIFRAKYEDIKEHTESNYIIVLKDERIQNKLLDFIRRAEGGKVKEITSQSLLECVEQDLKWNEEINQYDSADIKKAFSELVYYRKLIRKRNIDKHETNKIVLSSLLEVDAIHLKDEVDCYLYYRDINELYGGLKTLKFNTDIKVLVNKIFSEYGSLLALVAETDRFIEFERLLWVCCGLNSLKSLSYENLKIIFQDEYEKLDIFTPHLDKLVDFANLIGKRDKKYYVQKKDWAEKLILNSKIDVLLKRDSYKEILREGTGSLINVLESIKLVLRDYNLEGIKKVFKYNLDNLYELNVLIKESVHYKTKNVKELLDLYDLIINLFREIEYAESQIQFRNNINSHNHWENFYLKHLFDLQYRLSEIKNLDKYGLIEANRYALIDKRVSNILNIYRKQFAEFLKDNYDSWQTMPYGISRPILNSDISDILNFDSQKTYLIVFDGMRYDAWEYVVKNYFKESLSKRNTKYKSSFALLPTITSISREAIYSRIFKDYKNDIAFLTKSESMAKAGELKDIILQNKKINILVFNMFDKDGHNATEDFFIFYNKQKKVFENSITELLSVIPDDSNIVITSDHGLMRIDEYINIKNIAGIESVRPRYLMADYEISIEGCINTKDNYLLVYDNRGYFIGGGERELYSHGGASIEEVVVPFIVAESKEIGKQSEVVRFKSSLVDKTEVFELDKDVVLKIKFKPTEKEKIILTSLYNFKNQSISNKDIEKILKNKTGSAGLVNGIIRRLAKKLQSDGLDIIEETAVGDLILYKLKHDRLEEIY